MRNCVSRAETFDANFLRQSSWFESLIHNLMLSVFVCCSHSDTFSVILISYNNDSAFATKMHARLHSIKSAGFQFVLYNLSGKRVGSLIGDFGGLT